MNDLPIIELVIDEEADGLQAIALVDQPAIGVKGYAFSKKQELFKFQVTDQEKRLVLAAAMIPDLPIYRRDERGEYLVVFTKETIASLVEKFQREKLSDQFNIMHDGEIRQGIFVRDSWIVNREKGINPPDHWKNVADGSWFITAKVEDDATWEQIKANGLVGFSVEGMFKEQPYTFSTDEEGKYKIIKDMSTEKKSKIEMLKDSILSLFDKVKEPAQDPAPEPVQNQAKLSKFNDQAIAEEEVKMGEATLADGTMIAWEGDLEVGTAIKVVTPEGELSAEDGQWELEDGRIIVTEGGLVAEITDAPTEDEFDEDEIKALIDALEAGIFEKLEAKLAEKDTQIQEMKAAHTAEIETVKEDFTKMLAEKFDTAIETIKTGTAELLEAFDESVEPLTDPSPEPTGDLDKFSKYKSLLDQMVPKNTLAKMEKTNERAKAKKHEEVLKSQTK